MLNRRNLRIKVMQSLFALQQCLEADYKLAKDFISERFQPDLNSMEVQDKVLLKEKNLQAQKVFTASYEEGSSVESDDAIIKKVVVEAKKEYQLRCQKDITFFRKNLVTETLSIYKNYLSVLALARAFVETAEADKKVSHTNFVENKWLRALTESQELTDELKKVGFSWDTRADRIRVWFRDVIRQDPEYLVYLDKKSPQPADHKKFANHFFRKIILGEGNINDFYQEESLRWAEDRDIVKALVDKTIKSFNPESQDKISLHVLSLNWEEDEEFLETLFMGAVNLDESHKELIANNTKNWEVDRLPLTDRVILEMAIAEMLSFPNIPVKVTINEYIELAKEYSTPKSRQFINGILDVIAGHLKESGMIKKSGRGLMDNK